MIRSSIILLAALMGAGIFAPYARGQEPEIVVVRGYSAEDATVRIVFKNPTARSIRVWDPEGLNGSRSYSILRGNKDMSLTRHRLDESRVSSADDAVLVIPAAGEKEITLHLEYYKPRSLPAEMAKDVQITVCYNPRPGAGEGKARFYPGTVTSDWFPGGGRIPGR